MLSDHLILCHPLLLLPSTFPSIRVFSKVTALYIRWPKYWSFSISPSNEYSGFIPFRIDWFDLPAVQRTLKSLLQHHNSKPSILRHSAFFMVQLSHLYRTTGKTISLTRQTFVSKMMSLPFNMLSRAPNSLQMVTAAMKLKLKLFSSLEEICHQPRQHIKNQRHYFADKGLSSQSYGFSVVTYGYESWTIKKAEH